ncbi:MAG: C39 family peptidase [Treponema sp.]|nr:C39 family peptidase [Treponema sp.]
MKPHDPANGNYVKKNRYIYCNPLVFLFAAAAALVFSCGPRAIPAAIPPAEADGEQVGTGAASDNPFPDGGETAIRQVIQQSGDAAGAVRDSAAAFIDAPPFGPAADSGAAKFIVLSSPDDFFVVNGTLVKVKRYASIEEAPLDFSGSDQQLTKVRFNRPGFYGLTVRDADFSERHYSVFVSPLPTVHSDAAGADFDWYLTQFNTGTTSNCGPAAAAMGIAWSTGKYFPVSAVREAVGWQGDGGTSFEELLKVIKDQGIPAVIAPIRSAQSIKDVIDTGGIAVVLFRTEGVGTTDGDPAEDLFGKYYDDSVGHYIVIKGYSLEGEYFVIYDPIPSDWSRNSFRYGDDLSMIGRNRYYPAEELLRSLRRADMIAVPRLFRVCP